MADIQKIEVLTFDCYGTLIDWESGIRQTLSELTEKHQVSEPVDSLLATWEAVQFDMISGPYQPYRDILRDSLQATFQTVGISLSPHEASKLADDLGTWQPFDDTVESLNRLAKRFKLAILSNIDDDLLAQSVSRMGVPFDALITAQQLRSYKPKLAHFEEALRRFDLPAECFLHCAFGFKYDQVPALASGMSTVWVKRPGWIRDDVAEPTYQTNSLAEVVDLLMADT